MTTTITKTIPRKFFQPKYLGAALLNIRRFLAAGYTIEDMAAQITQQYAQANEEEKLALGKYLTAVYDFKDRETALKCGELFGVFEDDDPDPQRSVSYQIVRDYFNTFNINWLDYYSDDMYDKCERSLKSRKPGDFDGKRYWMVVPPSETNNVITLASNVYMTVEPNLTVNLLAIEDCQLDMLIEEEIYADDYAPLYFTECSHFISPVYKVKVAKKILEYCLERIGFPRVDIKTSVLFTSTKADLINKEEYLARNEWDGVNICQFKTMDKYKGFMFHSCPVEDFLKEDWGNSKTEQALLQPFVLSLYATKEIFNALFTNKRLSHNANLQLTRQAKKLGIFRERKW